MAVRRWQVRPDIGVPTAEFGVVEAVSREALVDAVLDGVSMLDRSGGVLTVVVGRHPTDLPGEMLTNGAVIEWKDHTRGKAQPEEKRDVVPPAPEPVQAPPINLDDPVNAHIASQMGDRPEVEPDGLDPATLEDEDLSEIPETVR